MKETKELTIRPDQSVVEVGNRIDTIVSECLPLAVQESQNFVQALTLANGIKELRKIFLGDEHIKETVKAMQNTHLGFMTDRTKAAIFKSQGSNKEIKPYRYEDVAEVCIEAMLKGYRITNNEFNMLVGRFYAAKNGKFRRIQESPDVTDFQFTTTTPEYGSEQGGVQYAKVQGYASWKKDGHLSTLGSSTVAEDRLVFKIRVNKQMGEDAVVGKALSKLFSRVLMRLEGKIMPESTDVSDEDIVEGETEEVPSQTSDLTNKIKQNTEVTEKEKEALRKQLGATEEDLSVTEGDESSSSGPETQEAEIVDPGGAEGGTKEETDASGKTKLTYYDKEFKGSRSNFEGKLRNHIKNGKIKEATEEDLKAIRAKWATNQETKDTPCPLPAANQTGDDPVSCICPPGGINQGDEMKVEWCLASCNKFLACDIAKRAAFGAGLWNPEDLS